MLVPDWFVSRVALPIRRRLLDDPNRSAERTRAHIEKLVQKPRPHTPSRRLRRRARIDTREWNGWPLYEVTPRDGEAALTVVFLHGGGYVNEINSWHWALVGELTERASARCLVPIYPLVPHATAAEVVAGCTRLTADTVADSEPGKVVLMGDSAGGGLALAAAMTLRDQRSPQPAQLILISPWLDLSMSDPRQAELEPKDKMQRRPGMAESGRLYAGDLPIDDPRVSPVNGDLSGLPPMTVFAGGHDLLDVDSLTLAERAAKAGNEVDLRRTLNGQHDFALFPTARGAAARREIIEICRAVGDRSATSA